MTHIRMTNSEVILVEESLDEIGRIINHRPQWIELTGSIDLNWIVVNTDNILYLYDDEIDLI